MSNFGRVGLSIGAGPNHANHASHALETVKLKQFNELLRDVETG